MQVLTGTPVSPGYANGIAVVHRSGEHIDIPRYEISSSDVDGEIQRFHQALAASCNELKQLEQRVLSDLGGSYSSIFSSHLALLNDRQFTEQVEERVRQDLVNAEQALDTQVADLMRLLGALESEYLRERADDIRDLGNRLMRQLLHGETQRYVELPPNSVIVTQVLSPSETIELDRQHVVGIITEEGGVNSHAAILARAMAIPAVTGVSEATSRVESGARLLVDGDAGRVTISPSKAASADLVKRKSDYDQARLSALAAEALASVTLDGVSVSLSANLNRIDEVDLVDAHHLDGVGLFRTEFLYMDSPAEPSLERQVDVYQTAMQALQGQKVVIRTFDLGGDKVPLFLQPRYEANPHLGLRGLRFSLAQQGLFKTQLRALLTAATQEDLRILFPMVLGESDLCDATRQVEQVADELKLNKLPRLGAMIETPAAIFSLKEILQQVDFVSIGTNDLTQFMLVADRDAAEMVDDYSVLHPSVLRAIRQVVQMCDDAGREVSVCGEVAGTPRIACLLVGLGLRQLSMSPARSPWVRIAIRSARASNLVDLAQQALQADSAAKVRNLLSEFDVDTGNHREAGKQ